MGDASAMPFDRGTVSYRRFALEGWKSAPCPETLDALRAASLVDEGEGSGAGWTAGEHLFDAGFDAERNLFGEAMLAAIRVDSDRVPADVRRAYLLSAMAEEMASADADRQSRRRARDTAQRRCDAEVAEGRWRRRRMVPVLADFAAKSALVPARSDALTTSVRALLEETLECSATALTSGSLAIRLADTFGLSKAMERVDPESFSGGAGGDEGGRPEPAWCDDGHPMDFLGNAFLLWCWWRAERDAADDDLGAVLLRRSIELSCPWDSTGSVVVRSDDPAARMELRTALRSGKWPRRAGLILARGGDAWEFTLQADRWEVSALKLPAPDAAPATRREAIEQRLASIREFDAVLTGLFGHFLRERLADGWSGVRSGLARWVRESQPRITREAALAD